MTEDNRSNDRGQLWLWVLVGLAILATIIMLLTDSNVGLKIALIAALWAAAIGAFMVGRYRNDKLAAERELELANKAHEAELKAHAAELANSKTSLELARAQEGLPVVDSDLLQEIKEEIAALRSQLEDLAGREWGYEPAALQAEARRVRELQAKTDSVGKKSLIDDTPVDSELVPEDETRKKDTASTPRPSTVDTTELGVVDDSEKPGAGGADRFDQSDRADKPAAPTTHRAPSAEAVAGRVGGYGQPTNRESNPLSQLISERREEADAKKSAEPKKPEQKKPSGSSKLEPRKSEAKPEPKKPEPKKPEPKKPEPVVEKRPEPQPEPVVEKRPEPKKPEPQKPEPKKPEPVVEKRPEPQTEQSEGRRGRRRRDENADGISVAELLARAKKAENE